MTNTANNTFTTPLQQFHTSAVAHKLSAGAILLWQYVYFTAQAQNKYKNLHLRTAEVLEALSITRNGLQKIRRNLVNAGLLKVRIDARQQVYYTLMINGETVKNGEKTNGMPKSSSSARNPKPYTPKPHASSDDILQNNVYRKLIDAFCTRHDAAGSAGLYIRLQQFLHRRKQQGKTLTKAGLDALLDKLVALAEQNVHTMIDIIQQSISRGWYGFYPYNATNCNRFANRSAVYPHYAEKTTYTSYYNYQKSSRIPEYDTKKEDLDFLEW